MKKKKILIVEDEKEIIKMLRIRLSAACDLLEAGNGAEGYDIAVRTNPDLIILDLVLPKLSGFAVLEKLKTNPATKKIPVIILTCLGQEEEKEKGMNLGAIDYLVKTQYTLGEIIEKINKRLRK